MLSESHVVEVEVLEWTFGDDCGFSISRTLVLLEFGNVRIKFLCGISLHVKVLPLWLW